MQIVERSKWAAFTLPLCRPVLSCRVVFPLCLLVYQALVRVAMALFVVLLSTAIKKKGYIGEQCLTCFCFCLFTGKGNTYPSWSRRSGKVNCRFTVPCLAVQHPMEMSTCWECRCCRLPVGNMYWNRWPYRSSLVVSQGGGLCRVKLSHVCGPYYIISESFWFLRALKCRVCSEAVLLIQVSASSDECSVRDCSA